MSTNKVNNSKRELFTNLDTKAGHQPHWAMVIDLRRCVGCQSCTVRCKVENQVAQGHFRTWVNDTEVGEFPETRRMFLPRLCNHCDKPSCTPVCPTGATFKRDDGIVVVDDDTCIGCSACVQACPYDARFINPESKTVDKCTFCVHRVEQGLLPGCVESCVGGSRVFGDLNDPNSEVCKLIRQFPTGVLKPEKGLKPNVFYIGLNDAIVASSDPEFSTWAEEYSDIFNKQLQYK